MMDLFSAPLANLCKRETALVCWLFIGLVAGNALGSDKTVALILRPDPALNKALQEAQAAVQADPTGFMVRAGGVILETDLLIQTGLGGQGAPTGAAVKKLPVQVLALEFFPDAYVEVEVTSETQPDPSTLLLHGRVPDVELATFTLTFTPESYLITFTDPHSTAMYRVVGEGQSGKGRVIEYDLSKRPPIYELPPLIPPAR